VGSSQAAAATSEAIELLPGYRVRFHHPGVRIDLDGIAKGFAVDRAIDILQQHGQARGLVNAGGDLAAFGPAPETVYVRHPRLPNRILCQVAISDLALASSGYLFDPLDTVAGCHATTVNPLTREFTTSVAGATVRAPSCMLANALTKVVMIAGERRDCSNAMSG
jgi:FAD:protein FMN transferase